MRITNNLMFDTFRRNLTRSTQDMLESQEIMATQKKINRVSDDPIGAGLIQDNRSSSSQTDQYLRNIGRVETTLDLTDTYISQIENLLTRVKELMLGQANSVTSTEATRKAAYIELSSIRDQLLAIANSKVGSRYLFSGTLDTTQPFLDTSVTGAVNVATGGADIEAAIYDPLAVSGDDFQIQFTAPDTYDIVNVTTGDAVSTGAAYTSGAEIRFNGLTVTIADQTGPPAAGDVFDVTTTLAGVYQGNSGQVEIEIEQSQTVTLNVSGDRLFQGVGTSGGVSLFDTINDAIHALMTDDQAAIDASLDAIDQTSAQTTEQRAIIGSRQNLVDDTQSRLKTLGVQLEANRTLLEDVDLIEAASEFTHRETAYQAALSVAARVGQTSLLDFLR